ncbi:MAG TPA: hypothetical protein VHM30_14530 [Gemmatimonadaceae bacterium]|nr:hypothetical protein [Gemmatimonadaceae bacterium]
MSGAAAAPTSFSFARAGAMAVVRARRLLRTRRLLLAAVMAILPWLAVGDVPLVVRLGALTQFTIVGLTVLGAGAIAEDLDGGPYAIAFTHSCSALEAMAGEAATTLLLTTGLAVAQLPFVLRHDTLVDIGIILMCSASLATLLVGWLAVMLLAATVARGVGNAIAMIPLLTVVPVLAGTDVLEPLPASLAVPLRTLAQLLPTPQLASEVYRWILQGGEAPRAAIAVLLLSPVVWFTVAAAHLRRLEPAARIAA